MSKRIDVLKQLQSDIHQIAIEKGWWDKNRCIGEMIALIHSELSEALEYARYGSKKSNKIKEFLGLEEELADAIIRIFDMAGGLKLRLPEAIAAKIRYNKTRGYRHGNKKF